MPPFDGTLTAWTFMAALGLLAASLVFTGLRFSLPPVSFSGGVVAAFAVLWSSGAAFAADDPAEIVRRAEERGRAAETALKTWAAEIANRSKEYEEEARVLASGNAGRLQQGMRYLEADLGVEGGADQPLLTDEGVVYVAVSFSMDRAALRALANEAQKSGAVLVIRGFVDGSVAKTVTASRAVFDENTAAGVAIDPQVFRAFQVTRVPTFIAARGLVEPCDGGVTCTSRPTPHDRLSGNLSLAHALQVIAREGKDAPDVAGRALARLER